MFLPIVSINKFLPLLIVSLCVIALSACGTGDGPDPEDRSPVSVELPVGHGLTAGEITIRGTRQRRCLLSRRRRGLCPERSR